MVIDFLLVNHPNLTVPKVHPKNELNVGPCLSFLRNESSRFSSWKGCPNPITAMSNWRMFHEWIPCSRCREIHHFHKLTWGVRSSKFLIYMHQSLRTCSHLPAGAPLLFLLHGCNLCRNNMFPIQSSIVERIQSSEAKKKKKKSCSAPSLSSLLERNASYRFFSSNSPSPVCVQICHIVTGSDTAEIYRVQACQKCDCWPYSNSHTKQGCQDEPAENPFTW